MPGFSYRRKIGFKRRRYSYGQYRFKSRYMNGRKSTYAMKPFKWTAPPPSTRAQVRIVRSPDDIVPDRLFVPLRYTLNYGNGAAASETNYPYLNSVVDCGATADTTSAYGATRLFQLYNYVRVWGSKIKVTLTARNAYNATATLRSVLFVVFPTSSGNNVPTIGSYQEAAEQPYAVIRTFNYGNQNASVPVTIQNQMNVRKMDGITKANMYGDGGYTHTAAAVPLLNLRWGLYWSEGAGVSLSNGEFAYLVQIEYLAEFYGRGVFDVAAAKDLKAEQGLSEKDADAWFDMKDEKDAKMPTLERAMSKMDVRVPAKVSAKPLIVKTPTGNTTPLTIRIFLIWTRSVRVRVRVREKYLALCRCSHAQYLHYRLGSKKHQDPGPGQKKLSMPFG